MFIHLHTRSWFSFREGGSSPEALAEAAQQLGYDAVALTDRHGVYGAVRFQQACRARGLRGLLGAEVEVAAEDDRPRPLVLLAQDPDGYARLCRLLSQAHARDRLAPSATLAELADASEGLVCLTGTYESRLWRLLDRSRRGAAQAWAEHLATLFDGRCYIEVTHHLRPGDRYRIARLHRLSDTTGVPLLATGDVRFATKTDYRRYDLLTCIRLGITVFDPHEERPVNAEAYLKSEAQLRRLIPFPEAFATAAEVARSCHVELLATRVTPPAARLPPGTEPAAHLRVLCREALPERYDPDRRRQAQRQLAHELAVIERLDLQEFFLVVHEIVEEARRRGIRCAGRGSAANSIVAYLLGITRVDPIAHHLLFERFLHTGRAGTPDIDVDFDTERRPEIIAWMERRFGTEHTAMTATLITYQLRMALRDVGKALGWSPEMIGRVSKRVPPRRARHVRDYAEPIRRLLGDAPIVDLLLDLVEALDGCPRHLGQHSGGMILSRTPLSRFTPVQPSANGVLTVQFDKEDVEALGLIKFDVLGLRMLAAVSEAEEWVRRVHDPAFDLGELPLDDVRTFNLIRAGRTLGTFQIESQGQLHLLAQHQPETFGDLITEVALFRPGPLQAGMVHPFVRRRRGLEPTTYLHPSLEPVLRDTYGVILFQEQVLQVAHAFAGMPLDEADQFRKLMSKFRDPGEMESMRDRFVQGAVRRGVPEPTAHEVFDQVAGFVGYGFCRSHAAAFAQTVYASCYLKAHYPAAFMAAIMQHRPGMYALMTLEEEARRFGVPVLLPDVHRSGVRYELEAHEGAWAIRKPLTSVQGVSEEEARALVWERLQRPFESVEDLYVRVPIGHDALRSLARSGALDALASGSRQALWQVGVLAQRHGTPGRRPTPALFDLPTVEPADLPALPPLTEEERLSWDLQTHRAARRHPMTMVRRTLSTLEIRPIETCYTLGRALPRLPGSTPPVVTVAGLVTLRQKPPTAKGVMFLTLEDETGFVQCVVLPEAQEHLDHLLRASALIVRGRLEVQGNWRGLLVTQAWLLDGVLGGYEGHPGAAGGRDRWRISLDAPEAAGRQRVPSQEPTANSPESSLQDSGPPHGDTRIRPQSNRRVSTQSEPRR